MQSSQSPELTQFAEDVLRGLSSTPKSLSSRYFYDDEGSRLFMEIMKLPEYYPTRAEMQIFIEQKAAICEAFTAVERGLQPASRGEVTVKKKAG